MSVISERIRALRLSKRLNQTDFGALVGVSQQVVHQWEAGKTNPDPDSIRRIAKTYGVSSDYLLGVVDVPTLYKHQVLLPDGREGALIDIEKASPSDNEVAGFLFCRVRTRSCRSGCSIRRTLSAFAIQRPLPR